VLGIVHERYRFAPPKPLKYTAPIWGNEDDRVNKVDQHATFVAGSCFSKWFEPFTRKNKAKRKGYVPQRPNKAAEKWADEERV
jgi:hypothetical protein